MLIAAVTLVLASAGTESVTGKVVSRSKPVKDAVVYLAVSTKPGPMKGVVIDQRGLKFVPHVTVVTPGTEIRFPNNDGVFHNVFAHYDAKRFDLGMYARGTSKTVSFPKPGVVALLCNVHPEMSAYVYVSPSPFFAVSGSDGRFAIAGVPSGKYLLHAWHESGKRATVSVQAGAGEAPVVVEVKR